MLSIVWQIQLTMQWVVLQFAVVKPVGDQNSPNSQTLSTPSSPVQRSPLQLSLLLLSTLTEQSLISTLPSKNGLSSEYSLALSLLHQRCVFLALLPNPSTDLVPLQYLNDSTLKNIHWALCTGVFGKRDVGRIEREFLDVLDWELSVSEEDLLVHHADISAIVFAHTHPYAHAQSRSHSTAASSHSSSSSSPSSSASSSPSNSRHHPYSPYRSRNHNRSSAPVPELEPSSSPLSSDGSSSPQTPSSLESSPDSSDDFYHPRQKTSTAAPAKSSTGGFHDILRSFPIPSSTHHRSSHPSRSYHTQTQFPIQV